MTPLVLVLLIFVGHLQVGGVVGNPISKLYHRPDLAHTQLIENPVHFESQQAAEEAGYHPCPVCYYRHPPQISNIREELLLAGQIDAQVRTHYAIWRNPEAEMVLRHSVDRVLNRWPLPLRGYQYRVALLDVDLPNAIAVPAGAIYITRGMYEAIESEAELDAITALQVAHIEGRHGLRSYESAQGIGALGQLLGGLAAASTGIDLSRVINYAKKVVLTGYSRTYQERAQSLMIATLQTKELQAGARLIYCKLADLYGEFGQTRLQFATILATEQDLQRLQTIEVIPVQSSFSAAIPRAAGLTATLSLKHIACDGSGCQIYAFLEIGGRRPSGQAGSILYIADPPTRRGAAMELILKNDTGAELSWQMSIIEKQLRTSTVLGRRGTNNGIKEFLTREIVSVTLLFQFTTSQGGNPIGDRLILARSPGGDTQTGRR